MTSPIWKSDESTDGTDDRLMAFMAGEDIVLDRHIFQYDIRASKAHVRGLERIDVLSAEEAETLDGALDRLGGLFAEGDFALDGRFEDCHSAIEWWLTDELGDLGKKVHTGRSRNDQVLVALRLYMRDRLEALESACRDAAEAALDRAEADDHPMPGYTHLQRAVPSSTATWFAGFAEAFIDNARLVAETRRWVDANPLGTAAGYGVNLPLDRDFTTDELGFERMQINPIYAQNSRGKFELQALMALAQALIDVRRLSWDLSLFTTGEFAFVELPDRYVTGSSIMPNKRNPDVVELLRGAASRPLGAITELQSLLSLPSGYQRDLQHTKRPLVETFENALAAISIAAELLADLTFDPERMAEAHEPGMFATDRAIELTGRGVPFREAYQQVKSELEDPSETVEHDPRESLEARISPGAPGNLQLERLRERLNGDGKG
jgi:argininosuccinate lyase